MSFKGDYIGFTYNGIHSSDLGIVRTSNGSRFNENLLPIIQDKTVQVPGGDGMYYFGSYYTQQQFSVSFAFDSLTEEQLSEIKQVFGDKQVHDLIFDEAPYKIYSAKVTGNATIKYIPFEEGETNRVYKGEGTIQFTCYQPFARSRFKWLDEYDDKIYTNKKEWAGASGMKTTNSAPSVYKTDFYDTYYTYKEGSDYGIVLWNPGDKPVDFILYIPFKEKKIISDNLRLWKSTEFTGELLEWKDIEAKDEDAFIGINTKLNLIQGYDSAFNKTGNIYNEFITQGTFFKIPNGRVDMSIWFTKDHRAGDKKPTIEYKYFYF